MIVYLILMLATVGAADECRCALCFSILLLNFDRTVTSASQTKVPMSTAGQTGRVVTVVSPSSAGGTSQKLQGNGVAVNSSTVPTAVVSAAHIQTSPQTKVLMHVTGQMTVNQARNAVRTGKKKNQKQTIEQKALHVQ